VVILASNPSDWLLNSLSGFLRHNLCGRKALHQFVSTDNALPASTFWSCINVTLAAFLNEIDYENCSVPLTKRVAGHTRNNNSVEHQWKPLSLSQCSESQCMPQRIRCGRCVCDCSPSRPTQTRSTSFGQPGFPLGLKYSATSICTSASILKRCKLSKCEFQDSV
jgi:hypothetical protein